MSREVEFFKQFIIQTAEEFFEEFDPNERDMYAIDNYADYMINRLEDILKEKK